MLGNQPAQQKLGAPLGISQPCQAGRLAGRQPAFSRRKRVLAECEPPTARVGRELWHQHLHTTVPVPNLPRPENLDTTSPTESHAVASTSATLRGRISPECRPLAACRARSGDANRISQNGNRRTMTTVDIHRHASHKPLHDGDMESVLWGIEKGPLLRQTMTAVLILDRPPDRETLLDRLERALRTLPRYGTGWWKCPFACRRHAGSSTRISIC